MRRTFWIVLLAAGTVLGFGAGFAHLCGYGPYGHYGHGFYGHGWNERERRFEDRAADACVRAAERVLAERRSPGAAAPAPAPATPAP
ncbi:MAG TPA: hypothetical protein VNN72_16080 [Polyangiaceae bacterium]|nr:hypothetical protein [Polyangiaceae bacterium]